MLIDLDFTVSNILNLKNLSEYRNKLDLKITNKIIFFQAISTTALIGIIWSPPIPPYVHVRAHTHIEIDRWKALKESKELMQETKKKYALSFILYLWSKLTAISWNRLL